MAGNAGEVDNFGVVHLAGMLNIVRLAISAATHGESAEVDVPLTEGAGRLRYGSRTIVKPGIGLVVLYSYRLTCGTLRSEETLMLGQILGDDMTENAGPEGTVLLWELGENFQSAAEIASAFSAQWSRPVVPYPDVQSRGAIMAWVSRRLGEDRIGESIELDGSARLIMLVPGEVDPPVQLPLVNGVLGRGIYAVPPLALHRLSLEEPELMGDEPVSALTIHPRGAAVRWRDRLGRMAYVVPPESRGLLVRSAGLLNPIVLEEFPEPEPGPIPPEDSAG